MLTRATLRSLAAMRLSLPSPTKKLPPPAARLPPPANVTLVATFPADPTLAGVPRNTPPLTVNVWPAAMLMLLAVALLVWTVRPEADTLLLMLSVLVLADWGTAPKVTR